MINFLFKSAQNPLNRWWLETAMVCRAVFFKGSRFQCPCCGWNLRAFTRGGMSFQSRTQGYCPRCNSKARHRRDWLYLIQNTNLFSGSIRLLHVSPKYALSRRLVKMPEIDFVGVDIEPRPNVKLQADITDLPLENATFDAVICIHVLEHVPDDRRALSELYRVLKPGGWALISVPLRDHPTTYEDPSITDPEDRRQAFGEEQHVRHYGMDICQRLEQAGFHVQFDPAENVEPATRAKFGLMTDENVFLCTRPGTATC